MSSNDFARSSAIYILRKLAVGTSMTCFKDDDISQAISLAWREQWFCGGKSIFSYQFTRKGAAVVRVLPDTQILETRQHILDGWATSLCQGN